MKGKLAAISTMIVVIALVFLIVVAIIFLLSAGSFSAEVNSCKGQGGSCIPEEACEGKPIAAPCDSGICCLNPITANN
ncbi:hypothetical protein JXB11_02655 [Candidatus Woesearchaeota archaeon]|nr:hypothetical protein [Candidatus Woesearchaeota archaeon]